MCIDEVMCYIVKTIQMPILKKVKTKGLHKCYPYQ